MNDSKGKNENEQIRREASAWVDRLQTATADERSEFDEWVRRDPRHGWEFLELVALDLQVRRCDSAGEIDVEELLRRASEVVAIFPSSRDVSAGTLSRRSVTLGQREKGHRERSGPFASRPALIAASLVTLVAIGAAFFATADENTFETSAGQTLSVSLADGSTARLNSGSRIHVRFRPRTRDIDLLQGEAMFEVAHDASRPFRVHAHGITAQALGTRFDVKETGDTLSVLVVSGRVAVFNSASRDPAARPLELTARQRALVSLKTGEFTRSTLLPRELRAALAWVEGSLQMHGKTLRETMEEFNAANSAKQFVIDDPTLNDLRLGGALDVHNPEGLAKILSAYGLGVSARSSGGTIEWHITGHPNSGSADPQPDLSPQSVPGQP